MGLTVRRAVACLAVWLAGIAGGFIRGLRDEPERRAERDFEDLRDEGGWG